MSLSSEAQVIVSRIQPHSEIVTDSFCFRCTQPGAHMVRYQFSKAGESLNDF